MSSNNWEKEIKEKIGTFSTVDLEGLWDDVDNTLTSRKAVAHRRRVAWLAACASIAAAVLLAVFIRHDGSDNAILPEPVSIIAKTDAPDLEPVSDKATGSETMLAVLSPKLMSDNKRQKLAEIDAALTDHPTDPTTDKTSDMATDPITNPTTDATLNAEPVNSIDYEAFQQDDVIKTQKKRDGNKFKLLAQGGALTSASNAAAPMYASAAIRDVTILNCSPEQGNVFTRSASEYNWTIGGNASILLEWSVSKRIGVSSGVTWTMLKGKDSQNICTPALQYIGIPLHLSGTLIQRGSFSMQAVCGPRVDFLLKGSPDVESNPLQFSAQCEIHAEHLISRHFGYYAGLGADIYIPTSNKAASPFSSTTPVPTFNIGLLFKL